MSATILSLHRLLGNLETMFFPMADDQRLKLISPRGLEVPQYVCADEIAHSPQTSDDMRLSFTLADTSPGIAARDLSTLSGSSLPSTTDEIPLKAIGSDRDVSHVNQTLRLAPAKVGLSNPQPTSSPSVRRDRDDK